MKKLIPVITILIVILVSVKVNASNGEYRVHFIDVGQEECILIQGSDKSYLIDTARDKSASQVIEYLNKQGINRLDNVIITHYHDDHFGGLKNILEQKIVNKVILPEYSSPIKDELLYYLEGKKIKIEYAKKGFEIKSENIELKTVLPEKEDLDIENNNSVVLSGKIDGIEYVFASDIEKHREKEMLEYCQLKKCDVLKVPHHGLNTSSSEAFIKALSPRVMVITSDGIESPEKEVLKRYSKLDGIIFRSDLQGHVVIRGNPRNKTIEINSSKVIK